jgi:hypothetical protein
VIDRAILSRDRRTGEIAAQARTEGLRDVRRDIANGTASDHETYRTAYDAAYQAGLQVWAAMHGKADAAKAAHDEHQRRNRSAGRTSSCEPVRWNRS